MKPLWVTNGVMPIIVATRREFIAVLDDFVFCHACESEESAFTEMYYIPILDCIFCGRCLELYQKGAVVYNCDKKVSQRNYNRIQSRLKELGVWEECSGIV